jgi:hypothetical protein
MVEMYLRSPSWRGALLTNTGKPLSYFFISKPAKLTGKVHCIGIKYVYHGPAPMGPPPPPPAEGGGVGGAG